MTEDDLPDKVAVDANFLVKGLDRKRKNQWERAQYLLERLQKKRGQLIIPMPALAEYLVMADLAAARLMEELERKAFVRPEPFDRKAAQECSQLDAAALGRKDKKDGLKEHWQKIKIDRQNVAIAKACGAGMIVSDDEGVIANALRVGIRAVKLADLPISPDSMQGRLPLKKGRSKK